MKIEIDVDELRPWCRRLALEASRDAVKYVRLGLEGQKILDSVEVVADRFVDCMLNDLAERKETPCDSTT